MDTTIRNSKIAEHLQKRFKERHNIELTRNRRLMLLRQIQGGIAKKLSHTKNKKTLYRVFLYNNLKQANDNFSVLYCPKMQIILTVLPKQDSDEYKAFCDKNGISLEKAQSRELTAQERTNESVKACIQYKQDKIKADALKRREKSLSRLKEYKSVKKYFEHA